MAARLSWPVAAVVGCLLVAVLAITVQLPVFPGPRQLVAAREYLRLTREVRAEALRLRGTAQLDSVNHLLSAGPGLTVAVRLPLSTAEFDSVHEAVLRELGDTTALRARIGVFLIGAAQLWPGAQGPSALYQIHATTEPEPTCVVIGGVPQPQIGGQRRTAVFRVWYFRFDYGRGSDLQVLGGCRFWARYGAPGARVQEWLERRGYAFADLDRRALSLWPDTLRTRGAFGRRLDSGPEPTQLTPACQAGDAAACTMALFGTSEDSAVTAAAYAAGFNRSWLQEGRQISGGERALLAALESEFGTERFARFWRSDQDVAAAFESAFGVSAGEWLLRWLERSYGPAPHGPGMSFATAGLSLLAMAVLLAAALGTHRARNR